LLLIPLLLWRYPSRYSCDCAILAVIGLYLLSSISRSRPNKRRAPRVHPGADQSPCRRPHCLPVNSFLKVDISVPLLQESKDRRTTTRLRDLE